MVPAEERPPRPSAAAGRFWGSKRCGRGIVANHARMSAPTCQATDDIAQAMKAAPRPCSATTWGSRCCRSALWHAMHACLRHSAWQNFHPSPVHLQHQLSLTPFNLIGIHEANGARWWQGIFVLSAWLCAYQADNPLQGRDDLLGDVVVGVQPQPPL